VDDPSLLKDIHPETIVVKRPIWEPYSWYKRFLGLKSEQRINAGFISESQKPKIKEKIAVWIRGNLFIPDARRFWIGPSTRFLRKYLPENPVDMIVTTGPPHSMHLIGLRLKKILRIPWVADFRDPWSEIDFYEQLSLTRFADRKHKKLEKKVLATSDRIIAVGEIRARDLESIAKRPVDVITNGYDESDFFSGNISPDIKFSIIHVGALNRDRNHLAFWKALGDLVEKEPGFASNLEVKLIGKNDISIDTNILSCGLEKWVSKIAYVPHDQIPQVLQSAYLLYLPINHTPRPDSIIPGKIFEYLASGRPILGTGPESGDAAAILKRTGNGIMVDFEDVEGIRNAIRHYYNKFVNGEREHSPVPESYSRKNLTRDLVTIFDTLIEKG
jgi:glycosyltransferase involved in cell wall biosynthesis